MYIKKGYLIYGLKLNNEELRLLNELHTRYTRLGNTIKDLDDMAEFIKFIFKGESITVFDIVGQHINEKDTIVYKCSEQWFHIL